VALLELLDFVSRFGGCCWAHFAPRRQSPAIQLERNLSEELLERIMISGYIHDGQTRQGYIAEVPRLHPALRFTYRVMLGADRAVITDLIGKSDPKRGETLAAEAIAKYVLSWDLKNEKDESVPVEAKHVLRLHPALGGVLWSIVIGTRAPDALPDESDEESSRASEEAFRAALDGCSPEEHAAKNSKKA